MTPLPATALGTSLHPWLVRHKRAMVRTFCTVMLVVIAFTFLGPKKFTSEAKLFVRLGRESVSLDPTATTGQTISLNESRESEINSVFESLKSREVLSRVVAAVGPHAVLGKEPIDEQVHTAGAMRVMKMFAPYSLEDEAIRHLTRNLGISHGKKSNIINISYQTRDPELARTIVEHVVNEARETHLRVNRTDGSQQFFAAQVTELDRLLAGREEELRQLKHDSRVADVREQISLKLKQINQLQTSLIETEARLAAVRAELASERELLKQIPPMVAASHTTGMPNSARDAMREQLFALEMRDKELQARYTEEHPLRIEVRRQLDMVRDQYANEPAQTQVEQQINDNYQEIDLATVKNEAVMVSLEAHALALRGQLAPLEAELAGLVSTEVEIARLEREIEMGRANYKKYSDNLEQARIDHELEIKEISNLNMLQPPSYSITPTGPRRLVNLSLGVVLALSASLGVALFREQGSAGMLLYSLLWPAPANSLTGGAGVSEFVAEREDDPWSPGESEPHRPGAPK